MRAAQVSEDLSLRVRQRAVPRPRRGEVLVRVHAAGVCGTDLHITGGMHRPARYPMTLGHEAAGVVAATGPGASIAIGSPVAIYNKLFCGVCEQCLQGRQNLCDTDPRQLGLNVDGGDADYVAIPEANAVPVPETLDLAIAAVLTCAGMTAVHVARTSGLRQGETAVVNGIGGVGILLIQVARHAGARVLAVCDSADKLRLALDHGAADGIVVPGPQDYAGLPAQIQSLTKGRGADAFFELVGTGPSMRAGISSLTKRGRIVLTGYTSDELSVHPLDLILGERSVLTTVAAARWDLETAIGLAASGTITVPIAARFPLEGIDEALAALRERRVLGRQVLQLASHP
jgi:propanol-preferring alcohol dehydrogenase